jgi:DNA-binding NtrC family response regulator
MYTLERELSVLVIDDDADLRRSIVSYLDDVGFTVIQASGGRQGIEQFRLQRPDLVLTDLMMPEVDGLAVVREVTRLSPGTPVVVLSGNGSVHYAMDAIRNGAWDYITKPVLDFALLDEVMGRVFERARSVKEQSSVLGQLAGGIAHDFRNVLTDIAGNLYLAQVHLEATHESAAAIKRAEEASQRANELTEKLMMLSKPGLHPRKPDEP